MRGLSIRPTPWGRSFGTVALTLALAGCAGEGSPRLVAAVPPGALVVDAMPGLALDRRAYRVAATGGKVTLAYVQRDATRHTLVVVDAAGVRRGETLEVVKPGDIAVATFSLAPGEYQLICDMTGHGPMRARLTVD